MTDISVSSTNFQTEKRSWLLSQHGTDPGTTPSITLAVATFTQATHFPNGFILSGIVLGKITASGLYGPYLAGATDGRQTAAYILFSLLKVPPSGANVAGAGVVHGFVDPAKLPIASGVAGGLDAAAQTALKLIHFGTAA